MRRRGELLVGKIAHTQRTWDRTVGSAEPCALVFLLPVSCRILVSPTEAFLINVKLDLVKK